MQVDRQTGHAPRTRDVASRIVELKQGCVGCADCRGLCHELIETMLVPDLVLKGK
ncbi:hypothetical protein [Maritimibacter sp. UBA3975]|uniref:hypothetical protein n=1 Tax=Maritimibacter sp. UBA3975 TaxID=1946833 RepID=UPI0025BD347A|nr:hypothetical protein [Maritimibacter sp. UBA3975]|tara:strand:+ start:13476 stop:13640 length:165 start_codon:yes stop_codon:yes gene_type:complete